MKKIGPPSKLSEQQWKDIYVRVVVNDESRRAVAKEYGITEGAIRQKFPNKDNEPKIIATQIMESKTDYQKARALDAFKNAPKATQNYAVDILADLQEISSNITNGAKTSSVVYRRMSELADIAAMGIDPNSPDRDYNLELAKDAMRYIQIGNEAAKVGTQLITANRALVEQSIKEVCDTASNSSQLTNEQVVNVIKQLQNSV